MDHWCPIIKKTKTKIKQKQEQEQEKKGKEKEILHVALLRDSSSCSACMRCVAEAMYSSCDLRGSRSSRAEAEELVVTALQKRRRRRCLDYVFVVDDDDADDRRSEGGAQAKINVIELQTLRIVKLNSKLI